jgi:hypothetical protein
MSRNCLTIKHAHLVCDEPGCGRPADHNPLRERGFWCGLHCVCPDCHQAPEPPTLVESEVVVVKRAPRKAVKA